MKQILVTGGAGYVGSGLVRTLLDEGHHVICVDRLMFGGESLLGLWHHPRFEFVFCDVNDHAAFDMVLRGVECDAVVHLAAIVGDPACRNAPELAQQTNWETSRWLADRCVELGIPRLVFASTCSNYGKMGDGSEYVTEYSALAPVSLYAETKVRFERYLLEELPRRDDFCPVVLRFATVYGVSPRMRFDLTVNEFTKELALGRELAVFGEQFWRPYCHVRDFWRALLATIDAPAELVAYDVFNVGDTTENYTKRMLVEEIAAQVPGARITYVHKDEDPRDYRVNCDKIKKRLGFEISMTVPDGIAEVRRAVTEGIIRDPDDQRYYNIPHERPAASPGGTESGQLYGLAPLAGVHAEGR